MLEELQQYLWTVLTSTVYVVGGVLALAAAFGVGYLCRHLKERPKHGSTGDARLDAELESLKYEVAGARNTTSKLLEKAGLTPASAQRGRAAFSYDTDREPRWEKPKAKFLRDLLHLFRRKGKSVAESEASGAEHPGVARLQDARQAIKSIEADVKQAYDWWGFTGGKQEKAATGDGVTHDSEFSPSVSNSAEETSIIRKYNQGHSPEALAEVSGRSADAALGVNVTPGLLELYNRAVTDTEAREQFRDRHMPIRFGTVNAVERRQNPTLDPEFREATDGDFFAFAIPGRKEYAVMPRLGLTIESVSYGAGALGKVFDCPRYEPGLFYSRYRVRRPATFNRDGDRWELRSPGELDLWSGD